MLGRSSHKRQTSRGKAQPAVEKDATIKGKGTSSSRITGLTSLFRRKTTAAVHGAKPKSVPVDAQKLRRVVTDETAFPPHRTSRSTLSERRSELPNVPTSKAAAPLMSRKDGSRHRKEHREPSSAHMQRQTAARIYSGNPDAVESVDRCWGPPPARYGDLVRSSQAAEYRSTSLGFAHSSSSTETLSLLRNFESLSVGHASVHDTQDAANKAGLKRSSTYSASTARGVRRSANPFVSPVTSTARARPTCAAPTAEELSKRSSQFVGQWRSPSTTRSTSSPMSFHSDVPLYESVDRIPPEEEEERLDDAFARAAPGMTSSFSTPQLDTGATTGLLSTSPVPLLRSSSAASESTSTSSATKDEETSGVWAVARGWRRGMYETYAEAQAQINGFPGPLVCHFATRLQAVEWLDKGALNAQRIPSVRTLAIDEDVYAASKGKPSLEMHRDSALDRIVARSNSLRQYRPRTHVLDD